MELPVSARVLTTTRGGHHHARRVQQASMRTKPDSPRASYASRAGFPHGLAIPNAIGAKAENLVGQERRAIPQAAVTKRFAKAGLAKNSLNSNASRGAWDMTRWVVRTGLIARIAAMIRAAAPLSHVRR